jgi:hypothetical protein
MENRGGVYNPGQQVEVNVDGVWRPGEVQTTAYPFFTVRNIATGRNLGKGIDEVRPEGAGPGVTGANTNIIPGDRVEFQRGTSWRNVLPGILVSKNYLVVVDNRQLTVPHTRLRRAPEGQPLPEAPAQPQARAQRQLRQPTAVEPNPPYRVNDSVECFADDPNTGRGVWNQGVIREQGTHILAAFVIANEQTGRQVERVRTDVFTTINRTATNSVRIGDTVMYDEPRVRGIVMDKIYYVSYTNTRGQRLITEKRTGEIRRPQGQPPQPQPQAQAAQAPAPAPRAPRAPAQPQPIIGRAFEIHNAFPELNFRKFMTIVKRDNNGASNFKDATYPLQPLITYINSDTSTTLDATEKTSLTSDLNGGIKTRLNMYLSEHPKTKNSVMEVIQFVMSQGPDYKDPYIRFLAFDCMNAYGPGGASCTKGVFERVFLINKSVLIPLCSDDTSSASSSTSSCKEVYRELLGCFYPDMDLNALFGEWYAINNLEEGSTSPLANASEEERKEDFRRFVLRKVPRADPTAINNYIEKNENTFKTLLIGGRRRKSRKLKKTIKKRKNKTIKKRH